MEKEIAVYSHSGVLLIQRATSEITLKIIVQFKKLNKQTNKKNTHCTLYIRFWKMPTYLKRWKWGGGPGRDKKRRPPKARRTPGDDGCDICYLEDDDAFTVPHVSKPIKWYILNT